MTSLNKVMLVGRLGRDPEQRHTKNGTAVANFSMATTERYKDDAGAARERTEWHNVVAWAKLADFAAQYLRKGMLIYVEGRLQTRSWEKDGQKHYSTEIVAGTINFMEAKGSSDAASQAEAPPPETHAQNAQAAPVAERAPWD
jgi:single-strand DNA-binding protein